VPQLELLEAEDLVPGPGEVVRRAAAEGAEADDDVLELLAHPLSRLSAGDRSAAVATWRGHRPHY